MTREEAIELLKKSIRWFRHETSLEEEWIESMNMAIEALSAEDKTKCVARDGWIPCSERLPERDEIVLVSYKTMDTVHMCKYLDDGSENPWWSYNDDCLAWNNVILAWMPLPKPYRKDDEA